MIVEYELITLVNKSIETLICQTYYLDYCFVNRSGRSCRESANVFDNMVRGDGKHIGLRMNSRGYTRERTLDRNGERVGRHTAAGRPERPTPSGQVPVEAWPR